MATPSGTQWKFYTLPDNWFTHGAIRHAWKNFRAAYQDELLQSDGETARWFDMVFSTGGDGAPYNNPAYPSHFDGNSHLVNTTGFAGATQASTVTDSDGDEMTFRIASEEDKSGPGYYNIFLEYARHLTARRSDSAPAESGPQSYEGLLPDADDLDHLFEDGDTAPYDDSFAIWHGDADGNQDAFLQCRGALYVGDADPTGQNIQTEWFDAPLGLIWVYSSDSQGLPGGSTTVTPYMSLEVASGGYKGVKADPIFNWNLPLATARSSQ